MDSFDQDPNEQVNISLVNQLYNYEKLIQQLGAALIEAWPNSRPRDFTAGSKIRNALFAYRAHNGDSTPVPALRIEEYNPWNDTIVIEGVAYAGARFRNAEKDDHNE